MALQLVTVCDSLAGLTVQGMRIYNLHGPLDAVRQTPCMFPEPVDFISDFEMTRDSYGGGSMAKMTVTYRLHYTFLYAPLGEGRTGLDNMEDMTAMVAAIWDEVLAIDVISGAIDIQPVAASEFGIVPDPAGNQYSGCRLAFQVMEFVN